MYDSLELFRTSGAMARHAGARQAVTARNVANADTPEYQARSMKSFADSFEPAMDQQMLRTRANHLSPQNGHHRGVADIARTEPAPNGNTVSIEEEMLNAVAISREHNRALMIYRHGMTVLRTSLGR